MLSVTADVIAKVQLAFFRFFKDSEFTALGIQENDAQFVGVDCTIDIHCHEKFVDNHLEYC